MTITKFQLVLNSETLPMSSFRFSDNSGGAQGSCVIDGLDFATFITNNINETLTVNTIIDGVTTELITCGIEYPDESEGPVSKSQNLILKDIVFSGSIPAAFEIDNLIATRQLQRGFYNFTLPSYEQGWQYGMSVTYNSIDRFIESVSFTKSEGVAPTITLTEGEEPADDDEVEDEPGLPGCTYTLTLGLPSNPSFDVFCSSGYDQPGETHISPEGYTYDMFVFRCAQFTIPAESDMIIEFSVLGPPGLDTTGIASGYEFDLIEGEYTLWTDPTPTVYTYRGNGILETTLPAGIYTCRQTLYIDRAEDSIAWATLPYYVYVRYA